MSHIYHIKAYKAFLRPTKAKIMSDALCLAFNDEQHSIKTGWWSMRQLVKLELLTL